MRLLFDAHIIIWAADDPSLLSPAASATIQNPANDRLVSAATVWEIAIKAGLGKLALSQPFQPWITKALSDLAATLLPITVEYADVQAKLPMHHRDPFDRMLIAQSLVEAIAIVSADAQFDAYGISRIW